MDTGLEYPTIVPRDRLRDLKAAAYDGLLELREKADGERCYNECDADHAYRWREEDAERWIYDTTTWFCQCGYRLVSPDQPEDWEMPQPQPADTSESEED